MLVDIDKSELVFGMFVEAVPCPSDEFQRKRFVLKSKEDLMAIRASSALRVKINTALGHGTTPNRGVLREEKAMLQAVGQAVEAAAPALVDIVRNQSLDLKGLESVSSPLPRAVDEAPDVFVKVTRLKTKDHVTYEHSVAVSALMMRVGQVMDLADDTITALGLAGLVHDVGKLALEDAILKKPGVLGAREKALMRRHPQIGFDLLKSSEKASPLMLEVCLQHHELLDGSGYPRAVLLRQSLPCTVGLRLSAMSSRH